MIILKCDMESSEDLAKLKNEFSSLIGTKIPLLNSIVSSDLDSYFIISLGIGVWLDKHVLIGKVDLNMGDRQFYQKFVAFQKMRHQLAKRFIAETKFMGIFLKSNKPLTVT
jgi:hypothetical protein